VNRSSRFAVFGVGVGCLGVLLALALLRMPGFGTTSHFYRDHAVPAAVRNATANAVTSVNFDQRAIDTFGEETILLGSVIGVAALLRTGRDEERREQQDTGTVLESTRLVGYLMLGLTLLIGIDVVTSGPLTPGGGFQGGVILATGLHLLYVGGRYRALDRVRPERVYDVGEAFGAAAFAGLGIAGIAVGGSFLANFLPRGDFGDLLSAGSVPLLNVSVGIEVASGVIVLLARFLEQVHAVRPARAVR
jgi:multicomponent Na+:H+ antiporter subunit B